MQRENYATNTGMRTHSVIIQCKVLKQVYTDLPFSLLPVS